MIVRGFVCKQNRGLIQFIEDPALLSSVIAGFVFAAYFLLVLEIIYNVTFRRFEIYGAKHYHSTRFFLVKPCII